MELRDLLLTIAVREKSGPATAAAYDFQKYWGIAEILKRHSGNADYCIIFEHHEDIVVLDSALNPQNAEFYQIKTRRHSNWTLPSLTKRKQSGPKDALQESSILGKLIQNFLKYPKHTKALYLVSNAPFAVDLADENSSSCEMELICIGALDPKKLQTVTKQLEEELKCQDGNAFCSITFLQRTELSATDTETHIKGILLNFFERSFPDRTSFPVKPFLLALFGEVRRRNTFYGSCSSFQELVDKKGVSRELFENLLSSAAALADPEQLWADAQAMLLAEHVPSFHLQELKTSWRRYELKRPNNEDLFLQKLRKSAIEYVRTSHRDPETTLHRYLQKGAEHLQDDSPIFSLVDIQSIILFELMLFYAKRPKLQTPS